MSVVEFRCEEGIFKINLDKVEKVTFDRLGDIWFLRFHMKSGKKVKSASFSSRRRMNVIRASYLGDLCPKYGALIDKKLQPALIQDGQMEDVEIKRAKWRRQKAERKARLKKEQNSF